MVQISRLLNLADVIQMEKGCLHIMILNPIVEITFKDIEDSDGRDLCIFHYENKDYEGKISYDTENGNYHVYVPKLNKTFVVPFFDA